MVVARRAGNGLAWVAMLLSVAGLSFLGSKSGARIEVLVIVGGAALVVLLEARPAFAAAAATLAAVVFPAAQLPVPTQLAAFPIATVPFVIWLVKTPGVKGDRVSRALGVVLAIWFVFCWVVGVVHARSGTVLTFVFVVAVCLTVQESREIDLDVAAVWMLRLGTVLAAYAVLEGLVLHNNPLLGSDYARATPPLVQVWDHYRVTTLMGHPLNNGAGFAVAGVIALWRVLSTHGRVWAPAAQLVLIAVALALTEARSGIIAFGVGAVVLLLVNQRSRNLSARRAVAGVLVVAVFAVFGATLIARFASQEGNASAQARSALVADTGQALQGRYVEGVGTGEAEASRAGPSGTHPAPLESSYAEIAVGTGIVGLALFVAFFGWVIVGGLRRYETAGWAAALLTLLVAMGGFNAFEASHQLIIWLGGLVALATARPLIRGAGTREVLRSE